MSPSEPKCITCGLPVGDPPRLNTLGNGRPCPRCAERLLAELPPLLPGMPLEEGEPAPAAVSEADAGAGREPPDFDPAV